MACFIVLSCLLAVATGFQSGNYYPIKGGSWPPIVSKREAAAAEGPPPTTQDLYQLINETLVNATQSIKSEDLAKAAQLIEDLSRAFLTERGANVSSDDVRNVVNEIAAELGIHSSASNILDDPLTTEANKIDVELTLLQSLRRRGLSLEEAGESTDVILAAIEAVSSALQGSVARTAGIVTFIAASSEHGDDDDGDNQSGDVEKRQWSVSGHYSSPGNWGVGFSYTWGRR